MQNTDQRVTGERTVAREDKTVSAPENAQGLKRVKLMTSHAAHSRFLAELAEKPIGYLARCQVEEIPSPYAYSPIKYVEDWNGTPIVLFETSHRRYEAFEVPPELLRFKTEEEATDWHIKYGRKTL